MLADLWYSVEDVWLVWIASSAALSLMVLRSLRSQNWRSIAGFWRDEGGASYALPYLMSFPLYMIFVCWTIQSTMILVVKLGVMHAAHTAVRSAVVWRPADPWNDSGRGLQLAEDKAGHAARMAMVPYASGLAAHQNVILYSIGNGDALRRAGEALLPAYAYNEIYQELASGSEAKDSLADGEFVRRKFRYAAAMTEVTLSDHQNKFNEALSAHVQFRMPIHIPGTGMILGTKHWSGKGYYRDVRATATLPLETPESPGLRLGIDYDSSQL